MLFEFFEFQVAHSGTMLYILNGVISQFADKTRSGGAGHVHENDLHITGCYLKR